jgi:signal transduction histidine kinase/AmiR/NasT family two-component response regulator
MSVARPKILYIEDNPDNRMLVRSVLAPAGYAVVEAPDGLSGIEAALREQPAVILLDINLPGVDGYEVVAILRSFPHLADTPIVAVTAYAMAGDRERTLVAGCDGYIEKPIDVDRLAEQVRQFLGGKRERVQEGKEGVYLRELNQHLVYRLLQRVDDLKRLNGHFVRRAGQLERLHTAMQDVTSELDVPALLERLLPPLAAALGCSRLSVELVEPAGFSMSVTAPHASTPPPVSLDGGDLREPWTETEWRVPLTARGKDLGSMVARHHLPPGAAADEEQLLKLMARQVATAIENSRLYEHVTHTLHALEESQQRIVQGERLRALGEMAGGVAHDFNNVLAIIIGRAEVIAIDADDPEIRRQIDVIIQAALDATQTVKRIQEFTRVRRSRAFRAVDLRQLIDETLEMTRSRWKDEAEGRGVHYDMRIKGEGVPPIAGEASEIREVFTNILFNALDAMPDGGTVTFTTSTRDGRVVCDIADSGIGMPEDVRQRVFDPFFTTKGERGTGLGLSVVYGIVARHGGEIDVDSHLGAGTIFTLRFPTAARLLEGTSSTSTVPVTRSARVLVVDDEAEVLRAIGDLLRHDGHEPTLCGDAGDAIALIEQQEFDLVITDLGMPGLSGWDVARIVKLRAPRASVAMITGWSDRIDPAYAKTNGVEGVIAKPFRLDDLRRVMRCADNNMGGSGRPPNPPAPPGGREVRPPASAGSPFHTRSGRV